MTREPRIYLDPAAARCASDACIRGVSCARRLAEVPPGSVLADFYIAKADHSACAHFVSISHAAVSRPAAEKRASKPWPVTEE